MDLSGTKALVFGASGVLGTLIADRLAQGGAAVTRSGRRANDMNGAAMVIGDIRDPGQVDAVVAAAVAEHGALDIVVNAAGIGGFGQVSELDSDVVEELFLTNTFGPMFASRAALPHMNKGGVIASVSGVIAEQNMPGMAAYGASKAALRSFNEGFAREARRNKVRVLDVRPPHTETGLADRAIVGTAPKMPQGLQPSAVADVIVHAIMDDSIKDVPASAFG